MEKIVALSMRDHYLDYYRHYDAYRLEELDIKKHGYDLMGHINFFFNRSNSNLIITGDYGDAIFSWYSSKNTLEDIGRYTKRYYYFATKCLATSRPLFEYDSDKAKKDINDWLEDADIDPSEWGQGKLWEFNTPNDLIERLVRSIDPEKGFDLELELFDGENDGLKDVLKHIDSEWEWSASEWGKIVSNSLQLWSHALNLGIRWKKQQEAKNDK